MNKLIGLGVEKVLKSKIKVRLAELEMQQTEVAKTLGVAKQTINGWVNGRIKPPLETAFKIAKILECRVDDLWEYRED